MQFLGKYGDMALAYLKENHNERYQELLKNNALIQLMQNVNEEAYEKLDLMMEQYLKENPLTNTMDTMQSYKERLQEKNYAEEILLKEFIYQIFKN